MDSLPLWSIQHAIMTLNNPSGAEIMTAENVDHVQVSCNPKYQLDNLDVLICFLQHALKIIKRC